jgi:hypothetical protein
MESEAKIVPVRFSALGTTEKGLDQMLRLLLGCPSGIELQITLLSNSYIICKVLG